MSGTVLVIVLTLGFLAWLLFSYKLTDNARKFPDTRADLPADAGIDGFWTGAQDVRAVPVASGGKIQLHSDVVPSQAFL